MADAVLWALQPHILHVVNPETHRLLPAPRNTRVRTHWSQRHEKNQRGRVCLVLSTPVMKDSIMHLATRSPGCWLLGHRGTAPK